MSATKRINRNQYMSQASITEQDVINIVRSILINFPDDGCCGGLDTFAVIRSRDDFNHDSFGRNKDDFKNGHFYSKFYVDKGKPQGGLKRKFGALLVDPGPVTIISRCCDAIKYRQSWRMTIILDPGCKCDDTKETPTHTSLEQKARTILMQIWSEIKAHKTYQDQDGKEYWLTWPHAEFLNNCEDLELDIVPHDCQTDICDCIVDTNIQIQPLLSTLANERVGMVMEFETEHCDMPQLEMNYKCKQSEPTAAVQPVCATC